MHSVLQFGFVCVFKTKLFLYGEDGNKINVPVEVLCDAVRLFIKVTFNNLKTVSVLTV